MDLYMCSICSKSFWKRYVLLYHLRHHAGHYPYVCLVCQHGFEHLNGLILHQTVAHPSNLICKRCGQSFREDLSNHKCIEIRPYVCEGCGAGFTRLPELNSHSIKCEDYSNYSPTLREYHYCYKGSYGCHTCGLNFTKLSELIQHRITNHKASRPSSRGSSADTTTSTTTTTTATPKTIFLKQPILSLPKIKLVSQSVKDSSPSRVLSFVKRNKESDQDSCDSTGCAVCCLIRCKKQAGFDTCPKCKYCELIFCHDNCLRKHVSVTHTAEEHTQKHLQTTPCNTHEDVQTTPCNTHEDVQTIPCNTAQERLQTTPCNTHEDVRTIPCNTIQQCLQTTPCNPAQVDVRTTPCNTAQECLQTTPCNPAQVDVQTTPCNTAQKSLPMSSLLNSESIASTSTSSSTPCSLYSLRTRKRKRVQCICCATD